MDTEQSPRVVAVVPARGGSKGVPGKNLTRVGGRSLVARAVDAALAAPHVDLVVVSTDDALVAEAAALAGARVVDRPAELASDTASSESAVLHALDALGADPDVTVLVQCTSPFLDPQGLGAAVADVLQGRADVVFSAATTHAFLWRTSDDGSAHGVNHEPAHRARRQDRRPDLLETGAFYVMRTAGLRATGRRFTGRVRAALVPELSAVEVDVPDDLVLAGALAPLLDPAPRVDVDAVVTDFDGVHTDDAVDVGADGRETVRVTRTDGMGVALLRAAGVPFLVLSTETHPVVGARARKLGVPVLQGVEDKASALKGWLDEHRLDPARVAYLGNDVNDLACLELVGWPVAVHDAAPSVRRAARLVLSRRGGSGAVRELCDHVLAARQTPEEPA